MPHNLGDFMAQIFASYSRADRHFVDQFIPLIRSVYGNNSIWFDEGIYGGANWWEMILDEIGECDLFIYLISNESLKSSYCQAEMQEALRLHKRILPVIVRNLDCPYPGRIDQDLADVLRKTQYVDMSGDFRDPATIAKLYAAVNRLLAITPSPVQPVTSTPTAEPVIIPDEPRKWRILVVVVVIVIVAAGAALLIWATNKDDEPAATPTPAPSVEVTAGTEDMPISATPDELLDAAARTATMSAIAPTLTEIARQVRRSPTPGHIATATLPLPTATPSSSPTGTRSATPSATPTERPIIPLTQTKRAEETMVAETAAASQ